MIEFDLGLIADNAHVDAGGKLYILGEFRYIFTAAVPAMHQHLAVVARWTATASEVKGKPATLQVEMVDQDGKQVVMPRSPALDLKFVPIGPSARARGKVQAQLVLNVNTILLPKFGDYAFSFWVNGKQNGSVPFYVAQLPTPS